nr:hypothetical protein [Tanacetum cinerariifolium]
MALLQPFEFSIHDFYGFFHKMKLIIKMESIQRNGQWYILASFSMGSVSLIGTKFADLVSLRFKVGESSSAPTARPTGGFKADYGFVGTLDDEIRRDPEREVCYGITNTWDEMVEDMLGTPAATDVARLSKRMTNFVTTVRQYTNENYGRLDDAQDDRLLMSSQLNMLRRDRRAHARTARLMETEARLSRQAWVQSMDASDTTHAEKMAPKRTTRSTLAITTTTTTTPVTNTQLKVLIDQGVDDALAARDADRSRNGKDSHDSGTGVRRQAPPARECTYQDFMK